MNIYDIHTHQHPHGTESAIVQLIPDDFFPCSDHYYSVGLHPWDIISDWRVQMAQLYVMALHPRVLMIGEAGIDKVNSSVPLELQVEVMREHIRLSELVRKPLIIHCVKGVDEILALRKESQATLPWILHGFRGGVEQWRQLSRAGIWVSIGLRYNEQLIQALPANHLLLESDDTRELDVVYKQVAAATNTDEATLRHTVANNIRYILNLGPLHHSE